MNPNLIRLWMICSRRARVSLRGPPPSTIYWVILIAMWIWHAGVKQGLRTIRHTLHQGCCDEKGAEIIAHVSRDSSLSSTSDFLQNCPVRGEVYYYPRRIYYALPLSLSLSKNKRWSCGTVAIWIIKQLLSIVYIAKASNYLFLYKIT